MRASLLILLLLSACQVPIRYLSGSNPDLPYSKAVIVGNTVHVAGHIGVDPATNKPPTAVEAEVALMLDGFEATMQRAGVHWDKLVRVQVFCTDPVHYQVFNRAYAARFKTRNFPARAFIGSGPLVRGCRFEIQGTAVK